MAASTAPSSTPTQNATATVAPTVRVNGAVELEHVTVTDIAAGKLPKDVLALTRQEEAWQTR